jgi:hypothetical protein
MIFDDISFLIGMLVGIIATVCVYFEVKIIVYDIMNEVRERLK